jgi:hypothetical protein
MDSCEFPFRGDEVASAQLAGVNAGSNFFLDPFICGYSIGFLGQHS